MKPPKWEHVLTDDRSSLRGDALAEVSNCFEGPNDLTLFRIYSVHKGSGDGTYPYYLDEMTYKGQGDDTEQSGDITPAGSPRGYRTFEDAWEAAQHIASKTIPLELKLLNA